MDPSKPREELSPLREAIEAAGGHEPRAHVLVVDDDESLRYVLREVLEERGCEVSTAESAENALEHLAHKQPTVALVDIVLPGKSGLDLLEELKRISPATEVIIITSHASLETATRAIRQGAYDYLQKPFEDIEDVWITVERALEKQGLRRNNQSLLKEMEQQNRELAASVKRLASLVRTGETMATFSSLPELVAFFINLIGEELDVDRASVMLLEGDTNHLRVVASRGLNEVDVDSIRVSVGEGISGMVVQTGEPIFVKDAGKDTRLDKAPRPDLSSSFISCPIALSVPIKAGRKILGVLNVTNQASGGDFTDNDLSYVSGLTGQLAVMIERTRHYAELQQAYDALKDTQEQLIMDERIKALGQMAAGVAHDFNNALGAILAKTELIESQIDQKRPDIAKIEDDIEIMKRICLKGAETIKRIQDYTRIRKDVPQEPVSVNEVVTTAIEMTRPKWKGECEARGRQVQIDTDLGEVALVSGNVHELTQAIENLIFNAVEAMPEGGRLTFCTHQDGEQVLVEVSDSGDGMSETTRKQLFQPFFTTKDEGQGLGMSIIYGIISRHGGEVSVTSEEGIGSRFRVCLPALTGLLATAPPPEKAPAANAPEGKAKGVRSGSVMLVDDDDVLRDCFEEALSKRGLEVVAFRSPVQALEEFGKRGFDVVITDLSMPEMSGLELVGSLKRLKPDTPVILLSGWAMQEKEDEIKQAGIDFVLVKPCQVDKLAGVVGEALEYPPKVAAAEGR